MSVSISDEELKRRAPKTRLLAIYMRESLSWIDNLVLIPGKDVLFITFDLKIKDEDVFTLEDPFYLQFKFVEETRAFRELEQCKVSRLFFISQLKKFACFVLDEEFTPISTSKN
ncbi:MAG: hypothetical protein KAU62_13960 [Candidatus Heimdallarchaeota archaeon]|nr:hypothetical protein [Candidatus Heimdallarchaeota archaeon]MCK4612256.1 hypothetical protein [Candidatus Heimdallarchaeota archaeon]